MRKHTVGKIVIGIVLAAIVVELLKFLAVFAITFAVGFAIIFGILMAISLLRRPKKSKKDKTKEDAGSTKTIVEDFKESSPVDVLTPSTSIDPEAVEFINAYNSMEQSAIKNGIPIEPLRTEFKSKFLTVAALMQTRHDYQTNPSLYPDVDENTRKITESLEKFKSSIVEKSKDFNVRAVLDANANINYLNDSTISSNKTDDFVADVMNQES
jgi:hypothetical protein